MDARRRQREKAAVVEDTAVIQALTDGAPLEMEAEIASQTILEHLATTEAKLLTVDAARRTRSRVFALLPSRACS